MLSPAPSALMMLAAGIGIPVLAALNANLGTRLGSPISAALILFTVALCATGILWLVFGKSFAALASAPGHLYVAGLLVAFYVLSITFVAPHFGVGNAVFFVLLGQLVSAGLIDHFGLFGATVTPMSLTRLAGILVMGAGVFLTQLAGR
jgi:transporter family-2 protein